MTAINKVLCDGVRPSLTTVVTLYTAPSSQFGVRILAFTAYDTSGSGDSYNLHIVPSGGSADATNRILTGVTVGANAAEIATKILNQSIPTGGSLQVQVTTADRLAFRASGVEFS